MAQETAPLLQTGELDRSERHTSCAVIAERWWVLTLCCLMAFIQGGIWNTWGPIAPTVAPVYNMSSSEIALLANWGPICYFIFVIPSSWMLDVAGLRFAMIITMLLVFAGSGIRLFDVHKPSSARYFFHAGQFLNGLAGPVAMSASPVVSATFFDVHHRTTATSILAMSPSAGVAAAFLIGPLLIRDHGDNRAQVGHREDELFLYMLGCTVMAGIVLLSVLIYFPKRPRFAPSVSAATQREPIWTGFKHLIQHKSFWLCGLSYGVMTGVYSGWGAFLAPNIEGFMDNKRAQNLASWLGFWATIAGCLGGIASGFVSDMLGGRMKVIILILCIFSAGFFLSFALTCAGLIPFSDYVLFATCIAGGVVLNGTKPLFYEVAVEATYPVAEGSTTCLLTTMNNLGCLIFLFLPNVQLLKKYPSWANWSLTAACVFGFLSLIPFKERYKRQSVDLGHPNNQKPLN
eukprot:m.133926 g.133926  ORF g.133926 m.133926 type:complete len:460 (+) comp14681_c0_seq2:192-1571(+)